ncbi:MAG: O-antigen ligase family protein [Crocinitomicaceae bacterium]|nr:O-antigen ligase family protein [Crocinitomicaceae bacterium]
MVQASKINFQFIIVLVVMYVAGVWLGPVIYLLFPLFFGLFILKEFSFELFIIAIWLLMLSDYVPVKNATHDDLQFAKDLKFLVPLGLSASILLNLRRFAPIPKFQFYFIPFLIFAIIGLNLNTLDFGIGLQKTISFTLMYFSIPIYVNHLHRTQGALFWKALVTFVIGMLMIGIILRFAAPQIAMIEGGRFKSILGNPNGLGIFLNLCFLLWVIVRELKLATFTKRENQLIFFVILISVIWCGSRNAMMSMVIFYSLHRMIKLNWFLAIVVGTGLIVYRDLFFELFISGVQFFGLESYFRVESIEEGSGRVIAWGFAWHELQDYFFVGGGFGHDEHVMRPNYGWLSKAGHQGGVHNSYISLWMDSGLLGLISYFLAIFIVVGKVMKRNRLVIAFIASIMINIVYESWLVASLNPYTIIFLTLLTMFAQEMGVEKEDVEEEINSELETE